MKRGLGQGLDALFVQTAIPEEQSPEQSDGVTMIKVSLIEPRRDQPRKNFDREQLQALANSVMEHGVIQPIIVVEGENGYYSIIAGERRWRACRLAGISEIPAIVRTYDELQIAEVALVENLQREDLNPLEEATGYRRLMETYDLTQEEVAVAVGKSRPAVANAVRLLALPQEILQMVGSGEISAGHARCLLTIPTESAFELAGQISKYGLSVRETERRAQAINKAAQKKTESRQKRDVFYDELELALASELSRKVKISSTGKKGKIEIEFFSREELMDIVNHLAGKQ